MVKPSIEDVKNFWDARPCNIRHSQSQIGTKEYFDEVELRKYFVEPHIPKFAEFEKWKGKRVLEIGCGIGTDAVNFARSGADYTGIELSNTSLEIAKQRFDVYDLKGRLLEGDAESINELFINENFDLIYSFGVLHHTPNFEKSLQAIWQVCDKNTIFKFMVYAENSWKNSLIKAGLDQPEAQSGCPIANTYSKTEIEGLLKLNQFRVLSIRQDHIFPFKVEKYVNYEYEYEEWFKAMPSMMFQKLEKELGWHLLIEAAKV